MRGQSRDAPEGAPTTRDSGKDALANTELAGLRSEEARRRLLQSGPNAIAEAEQHLLRSLLTKFWAPVPWRLEATVVLELLLHKRFEALIISALLVFNAGLIFF